MKFIDFNKAAIECIPLKQLQSLAIREVKHSSNSDEDYEITIVCLSYNDGVISTPASGSIFASKRKSTKAYEDLKKCHYAVIGRVNGSWYLNLNLDATHFPLSVIEFKTREDAIKAARLCKNAKTIVEAGEIIAKEFAEFATIISDYLKWYEETQKFNNATHNV